MGKREVLEIRTHNGQTEIGFPRVARADKNCQRTQIDSSFRNGPKFLTVILTFGCLVDARALTFFILDIVLTLQK